MTEQKIRRRNRPNRYPDDVLLDAALAVFHERGFHDASMDEIAGRAGATKPTLYARFGNKEALYDRVMERAAQSLLADMAATYEGIDADNPEEAARRPFTCFYDWAQSNPTAFQLLFGVDRGSPTGVDHGERALDALTEIVTTANASFLRARGLKAGRATGLLAAFFVGIMHHGALWLVDHHPDGKIDAADFATAFTLRGLQGVSPEAISTLKRRRRAA